MIFYAVKGILYKPTLYDATKEMMYIKRTQEERDKFVGFVDRDIPLLGHDATTEGINIAGYPKRIYIKNGMTCVEDTWRLDSTKEEAIKDLKELTDAYDTSGAVYKQVKSDKYIMEYEDMVTKNMNLFIEEILPTKRGIFNIVTVKTIYKPIKYEEECMNKFLKILSSDTDLTDLEEFKTKTRYGYKYEIDAVDQYGNRRIYIFEKTIKDVKFMKIVLVFSCANDVVAAMTYNKFIYDVQSRHGMEVDEVSNDNFTRMHVVTGGDNKGDRIILVDEYQADKILDIY